MALGKVFLLALAALSHNMGLVPPQPPASTDDKVYNGQPFELSVYICVNYTRTFISSLVLANIAVVLASAFPHVLSADILPHVCPNPSANYDALSSASPVFLIGFLLMILGSLLRMWCFRTMGALFTYEVTVLPEHRLITSGPYSYARHPGYTAVVLMLVGAAMAFFSGPSYIGECGLMGTTSKWFIYVWICGSTFSSVSLMKRARVEDALMEKRFGKEWAEWRRHVPYSFIPGVL